MTVFKVALGDEEWRMGLDELIARYPRPEVVLYILDEDNRPVECDNLMAWGQWFMSGRRVVDRTELNKTVTVSTVFLGIDHRWGGKGPPILFETIVFGGIVDGQMRRYSSWDDAKVGHEMMVKRMKDLLGVKTGRL